MTQSFLYLRNKSTTHTKAAVFKEIDMQLVQIGNDFGTNENTGAITAIQNRVIHWENDIYAVNENHIYKYDVLAGGSGGTGDWEIFYSFSVPSPNTNSRAGFTPCSINGSGMLVTGYGRNFDSVRYVTIDKDKTVTEFNHTGYINNWNNNGAQRMMQAIPYRNTVIFTDRTSEASNPTYAQFDVGTLTHTTFTAPHNTVSPQNQFCVFNDKVYVVVHRRTSTSSLRRARLWRLDGTSFTNLGEISSQGFANTGASANGGSALIESDGKLYCLTCFRGEVSWKAFELTIDSNGNLASSVDVTSTILPSTLTSKTTSTTSLGTFRIDSITDPENPIYEFLVYNTPTEGQSIDLYRWTNHPSGQMVLVDAGLDSSRYAGINTNGGTGGGRIWSGSGTLNVAQPCLSLNSNGLDVDAAFTIYGPTPSLSGVVAEIYFDKEGEIASTRGTIASTSHGSIVGNQVIGLTADNVTEVTVGWGAVADGIQPGDNPTVAIKTLIP